MAGRGNSIQGETWKHLAMDFDEKIKTSYQRSKCN